MPNVALLHYWLTARRGGERVFAEMTRLFPEAEVFTHAYQPENADPALRGRTVHETFIARLPGARRGCQRYLPLMPLALRRLDLSRFDLLLSSEAGPVKGVRKRPGATHLCYCHSPMRYVWDQYPEYYRAAGPAGRLAMRLFRKPLQRYDAATAAGVDHFAANSRFVAERIRRVYGREAEVIYPPVDVDRFADAAATPDKDAGVRGYYLLFGQLVPYKRPDLAVEACLRTGRELVVAGDGPMRAALEKRGAGRPNVRFVGRVDDDECARLYANARALLFPGVEDFGIVPVEAQASGTPVVALGRGGALESVEDGVTGLFFPEPTAESLAGAMEEFEARTWNPSAARANAARFGAGVFRRRFMDFVARRAPGAAGGKDAAGSGQNILS